MVLVDNVLLDSMKTQTGQNLSDLSKQKPVLLVFLRHFGCQFCREAMDDLSKLRPDLIKQGIELVFVHMAENPVAEDYFKKFNLIGVQHISDLSCHFYAAFGLVKGSFTQLFGLQSWFRGFTVQAKYGGEVGKHLGDSFQMPGAFMVHEGTVKESYIHKSASDRPDYSKLVSCCGLDYEKN
jgi:peroxiredoxin